MVAAYPLDGGHERAQQALERPREEPVGVVTHRSQILSGAKEDDELGEVPVACVAPAPGRSLTQPDVTGLFEHRLANYKHPRDVIFLDALPRNATGKVDRIRLRALDGLAQAREP
jgi:acyl-CoA synthetase (AMP-forming)/AMP-acid ligase II